MVSSFSKPMNLQQNEGGGKLTNDPYNIITRSTLIRHSLVPCGLDEALQLCQLLDWTLTQSSQHITQIRWGNRQTHTT